MKSANDDARAFDPEGGLGAPEVPPGADRRTFLMRSAVVGAADCDGHGPRPSPRRSTPKAVDRAAAPGHRSPPDRDSNVVKKSQGPGHDRAG